MDSMKQFYILIFMLFGWSTYAQVAFKVELLSDETTYQVSIRSDETWNAPLNTVSTAQVSLIVPTGGFTVSNVQSINGLWSNNATVVAPMENPDTDYLIFGLQGATSNITFETGVVTPLFTFENSGACTGPLELLENDVDPFFPPNSQNVNVGNQMSVIGAGFGNAYTENIDVGGADCENPGNGGGSGGGGDPTGNPSPEGEDQGNCDDITISNVFEMSPSMCGVADGQIMIIASSPIFSLQFSIDGGDNWQDTPTFPGLAAGDFFEILVRDNAGICTEEWGILELDAPLAAVVISQVPTNPGCGLTDGSIAIEAESENNEPIEFSIDNGATWQASGTFTDLGPGTYPAYVRNLTTNCETFINEYVLVEDCTGGPSDCKITYHLDKVGDQFQISLTPEETYTFPNNFMSSAQMTFKVLTGTFEPGAILSQFPSVSWGVSIYRAPAEDPDYDYISIGLTSGATSDVPFNAGQKVQLYSFENVGDCTGGEVIFMDNATDPFFPPNSLSANVGQQITVAGGGADIPICVSAGVADCPTGPCDPEISSVNANTLSACGAADGSITINATASGNLQYSIDGGNTWQSNNFFNDLAPGSYEVMVQAGLGCELSYVNNPITLVEPDGPTVLTPIPDQTSCGGVNVEVSIEISESIMAFNVEGTGDFGNTLIDGQTATFDAIPTGNSSTFEVEIMGMSGCSVIEEFTLNIVDIPQTTFSVPINSCKNEDVEITYLGNAGAMATLNWNIGNGQLLSQSPANSTQPEAATIMVAWENAGMETVELSVTENGCESSSSSNIEIQDIATNISETIVDASGCGSPTGSISLELDGSANYSFNWEDSNGQISTNQDVTDLVPGDYDLTITNNDNTCAEAVQFTVGGDTTPPDLDAVTIVQPLCDGTLGSIEIQNPPSNPTFEWTSDNGSTPTNAATITDLLAGNYTVTVTDNDSGCTSENTFEITDAEAPTLSIDDIVTIDCDGETGSVTFSVAGSLTFEYELTTNGQLISNGNIDGGNTEIIDNLEIGNYILTVTNPDNGCEDIGDFPIYTTNIINVVAVGNPPSGCDIEDAEITLEITGTNSPFIISSNFGNIAMDTIMTNGLISDLYDEEVEISITDNIGCVKTLTVDLADIASPQLSPDSVLVTHAKCPDDLNAGIQASNNNVIYEVLDSMGFTVGMTPISGLTPGTYTVVHSLGDCDATLQIEIQGPDAWDVQVETVPETCDGNDGAIYISVSGGSGDLNIEWSNGLINVDTLENLSADDFFDLTITDSEGCVHEVFDLNAESDCNINSPCDQFFSQNQINIMVENEPTTEICLPNTVDLSGFLHFVDGQLYQPALGVCDSVSQSITLDSEPGQYVFSVMNIVTDCVDSLVINLLDDGIPDLDTIWVDVFESQTEVVCLDANQLSGVIDSLVNICANNATNNASVSFNEFPVLQEDLCIEITGNTIGLDQLCMVLCDDNGLCDTTVVMIQVIPRELVIYNGVSPNNDGINDHFIVENIELFPNNKIRIFNRWGTRVYETKGYRNDHGWYGTFEGNDLPDGSYFYMIDDGEGGMYSGYLFLQR